MFSLSKKGNGKSWLVALDDGEKTRRNQRPSRLDTFKVIMTEDIPKNAKLLPDRFVLGIKSTTDGEMTHKALFVIGLYLGKLKDLMVHSSSTLQTQSIRLLLALEMLFISIYGPVT